MIVDTAKAFASVFGGLYERYRQWTDARNDAEALTKLVCLELRRNLALLDALRIDDAPEDSAAFLEASKLLETEVLEQIFLPGKGSARLRERLDEPQDDNDDEADDGDAVPMTNHLMRLYVRIIAIQKLSALPQDAPGLRKIQYGRRLRHIRARASEALQRIESEA
ncbi:MAG TPA: hypothetical protein VM686_20065 [Polyangiaceae bacterium]|nr:hypothetical protein [Polyangiaceae bacterium]